ncbi:MAG: recombinase family protein [Lachnospiraceae bacterium]|nr:recombinase family protein [Lachnospiraceae bacterium]
MSEQTLEIGAAYIRVSTDEQTELSPDAQLRMILDEAKKDGVIIPPDLIFMEGRGRSGRRADNRIEFQRMIATARQNPSPFKYLYLWKFSRFARNQEESAFYKGILRKKCNVTIKSVSEPIPEGMFGRLIEMIIEWSDEFYSVNLSGEVLRGMAQKALEQGYQTTPCLGYDAVGSGKPFIINEAQYKIAEFIHQSYFNGKDITVIAREANALGYRTRRGNSFDIRAVKIVLTNSFYVGIVKWKDISFQGSHECRESITSVFASNQERLNREYHPHHRREASSCAHWLSGLLKCSICGSSLGYNRTKDLTKRGHSFQCWKYSKGMHPGSCSVSSIKAEAAVLESLKLALDTGDIEYTYERQTQKQEDSEIALIHEALRRLDTKERRIREAYECEIDTLEEYKANKIRLQEEREQLLAKETELVQDAAPDNIPGKDVLLKRIQNIYDLLQDSDVDYVTKGNAVRRIIKKIVYDKESKTFRFYYYI